MTIICKFQQEFYVKLFEFQSYNFVGLKLELFLANFGDP